MGTEFDELDANKSAFWKEYWRRECDELQGRVDKAVKELLEAGSNDGAHHKQWGISEALRILLGGEEAFFMQLGRIAFYVWDPGVPG